MRRLLNTDVQTTIDRLRLLGGNNAIYVSFNGGKILIKKLQSGNLTAADLNRFTELGLQLFDAAINSLDTGIEFLVDQINEVANYVICQVCGEQITDRDESVSCRRCNTLHHRDCWKYFEACSTYGCGEQRCVRSSVTKRV